MLDDGGFGYDHDDAVNPLSQYLTSSHPGESYKIHKLGGPKALSYAWVWKYVAIGFVFALVMWALAVSVTSGPRKADEQSAFYPLVATPAAGSFAGFSYVYLNNGEEECEVLAWRGIPFAAAPINELRWQPPQKLPPSPPSQVLESTEFAAPCAQIAPDGSGAISGSEDCLYLNVYSTLNPDFSYDGTDSGEDAPLRPVLFFIYGGGMMSGEATANFDSLLASFEADSVEGAGNSGLLVVEVAYRLSAFGFLATQELSQEASASRGVYASGNYGIEDLLAALHWTQDNIASFGGDPTRVTIAGQSSGGTSVFALLSVAKERAQGLFSGAISMSGSPNITMSLHSAEQQNAGFSAGCDGMGSAETLQCMRDWSVAKVLTQAPAAWSTPGIWNLPASQRGQRYDGLLIVDGAAVVEPFFQALGSGRGADVPLMLGNMQCEPDEGPEDVVTSYNPEQWRGLLNNTFGSWSFNASSLDGNSSSTGMTEFGLSVASSMADLYQTEAEANPQKAFDAIVSDFGLFCAQVQLAKKALSVWGGAVRNHTSNIFVYEDTWSLSQPYLSPWSGNEVRYPFHDLFYFMVTGQWGMVGDGTVNYVPSESDLRGSRLLQSFWRQFLRNSSRPSLAVAEEGGVEWSPADANSAGFNYYEPVGKKTYSNYSLLVISNRSSEMQYNRKIERCTYFNEIGLDRSQFWWVN